MERPEFYMTLAFGLCKSFATSPAQSDRNLAPIVRGAESFIRGYCRICLRNNVPKSHCRTTKTCHSCNISTCTKHSKSICDSCFKEFQSPQSSVSTV